MSHDHRRYCTLEILHEGRQTGNFPFEHPTRHLKCVCMHAVVEMLLGGLGLGVPRLAIFKVAAASAAVPSARIPFITHSIPLNL